MALAFGVLAALLLLIAPGAVVALVSRLRWPVAIAVGPAVTYGVVGLATIPFGALGIPWNGWTALVSLAVVAALALGFSLLNKRFRDEEAESRAVTLWPTVTVAAGVALGAALIGTAAVRGLPDWQSIPSTWDAVWHANTIRFILDTGQASPTHMGELRSVETQATLYYPSAFHALATVLSQLTGVAPTAAYTLSSLAASIWLFPVSAAALTWHLLRPKMSQLRTAGCAATAAALSASFTAVPYVEFDTAAMPNLVAFGLTVPTMALIVSTPRHRDRIPVAVLALIGVFSVHPIGGIVTTLFVAAWWLCGTLWRPVRGRVADVVALLLVFMPAALVLLPQVLAILQLSDILVGHTFVTGEGKKSALVDAIVQHTRHLNDFPVQYALIGLTAAGGVILLVKKIWWPAVVWLLLVVAIVYSSAPFGSVLGTPTATFSDLFYGDPRRMSAAITLLLAPMAGIAVFSGVALALGVAHRWRPIPTRISYGVAAALVVAISVGLAWHYASRHRFLFGDKYDAVMVNQKDLDAMAYLATLPGARDTVIGNANTDGTAWMYAVANLHPLWAHYDYPVQQGPGYHRFNFWAYADDADTDPRVADAVRALNIRYVLTSTPVVRGFTMPDGLMSLDKSQSWEKIYDNGQARIFQWRRAPDKRER